MSITDKQELREIFGEPSERSVKKEMTQLDVHCRKFIALSPFLVIGTSGPDGADVSPKGDAPGFVAILDEKTLVIPDRPGNNRVDTMQNLLDNPQVALLFMVPGVNETLRVNGRAGITTDPELLEPLAVKGKVPRTGLLVKIEQAFLHCPKAMVRSNLWDPDTRIDRGVVPSIGKMVADQMGTEHSPEADEAYQIHVMETLY